MPFRFVRVLVLMARLVPMVLRVILESGVLVVVALLVHPVVYGPMRGLQHEPHAAVYRGLCARADRVQVRHGSLDLVQDGQRVRRGEERCLAHLDHDGG